MFWALENFNNSLRSRRIGCFVLYHVQGKRELRHSLHPLVDWARLPVAVLVRLHLSIRLTWRAQFPDDFVSRFHLPSAFAAALTPDFARCLSSATVQAKVDRDVWHAIDALRKVGNIGAHMEADINVIVDVDDGEAGKLIWLIELLMKEWYIARHDRQQRVREVIAVPEFPQQGAAS